jgi:hypothetical protein
MADFAQHMVPKLRPMVVMDTSPHEELAHITTAPCKPGNAAVGRDKSMLAVQLSAITTHL